jgi:hypothetical protein
VSVDNRHDVTPCPIYRSNKIHSDKAVEEITATNHEKIVCLDI